MPLQFHTLDVFARTPLAGNPLAVVLDADGLDDARMQAIAREFNLSETVFVLTPRDAAHAARLRVFTPSAELPFAGHPTIGTAALLAELRAADALARRPVGMVLEEGVGAISCSVWRSSDGGLRASFDLPRAPLRFEDGPTPAALAAALGLDPRDLGFDSHRPSVWGVATPFIFAPLASGDALSRARPVIACWDALGPRGRRQIFAYCKETRDPAHHVKARVFAPELGVSEDPATGAAAAAFAGVAMEAEQPDDGDHSIFIEQGAEMGRPSLICLDLRVETGRLASAAVGGAAVRISDGRLRI